MRVLLKAHFDTEKGNQLISSGKMGGLIQDIVDRVHPEAAYFLPDEGERTAFLVFDLEDTAQIPVITEPLFREGNATVSYTPVMNLEDVQKGLSQLG
ncbi:hypothetical protein [Streptomyces sp. AC550_RSS872]|uniref:hypothetical protein n=1 Tax=Streptomyces sp. AC550_RSS872 TaxID=2823689 RepID=UPI001C27D834|nr:hypothetical protein [Streptomyces sp. AC550_RSS872]